MPISDARKRANDKYIKTLDDIKVRVPKGDREKYQMHATKRGESLNAFIIRAMSEAMERDLEKGEQKTAPD